MANPSGGTHKSRRQRYRIFGPVQEGVLLAARFWSTAQERLRMPRQQIGKRLERTHCISSCCDTNSVWHTRARMPMRRPPRAI